jgi:hypothetical protein
LNQAWHLRGELLKIPTSSPRGLLIKLAIAVEAEDPANLPAAVEESDSDPLADFARAVLVNLELVGRAPA